MEKYSTTLRILHWLIGAIIIGLIGLGIYMVEEPDGPAKYELYDLHKSFGVLVLILFFVRVVARIKSKKPAYPKEISQRDVKLAKLGHFALYALIFLVPVTGIAMSQTFGYPVKLFGYQIPALFAENKEIGKFLNDFIHAQAAYIFAGIIAIHVAAVIKHKISDKVNLLKRIT